MRISLKFVPEDPTNNKSALVQLAPNRQQAIISTSADAVPWCIYAALGGMS